MDYGGGEQRLNENKKNTTIGRTVLVVLGDQPQQQEDEDDEQEVPHQHPSSSSWSSNYYTTTSTAESQVSQFQTILEKKKSQKLLHKMKNIQTESSPSKTPDSTSTTKDKVSCFLRRKKQQKAQESPFFTSDPDPYFNMEDDNPTFLGKNSMNEKAKEVGILPITTKQRKPQGEPFFTSSDSYPSYNMKEDNNPAFNENISEKAKKFDKNERNRELIESQKRPFFTTNERSESSHDKKKSSDQNSFSVDFTAETNIQPLLPAPNNPRYMLMMNHARFTADNEQERKKLHADESIMMMHSSTRSLSVGESSAANDTYQNQSLFSSPRRREGGFEQMPLPWTGGDTLPANGLVRNENSSIEKKISFTNEIEINAQYPSPSLQKAFDAQQAKSNGLNNEYPTMNCGPFHSASSTNKDDRGVGKQVASLTSQRKGHYDQINDEGLDISIMAKEASSRNQADIDPSIKLPSQTMLLLQGAHNSFSLSSRDNSQESSSSKSKTITSQEEINKLIHDFFSSDNVMKRPNKVSGRAGKEEPKKHIVTYKFPFKLYFIVSSGYFDNIIKWTSQGKAFQIMNKDKFITDVLPLVFSKVAKFSSFHRKLNRWKFEKIQKEVNTWMHPLFQQGRPELCHKISSTNSTLVEQNLSVQHLLMRMRNQGSNAFQGNHQLSAPVTNNVPPLLPTNHVKLFQQNNMGSAQNISIPQNSMMQSYVYCNNPNQYMLLQNYQQRQQEQGNFLPPQAPLVASMMTMQQQQEISTLPTTNNNFQSTQLGMTLAPGTQSEKSMFHNQISSIYAGGAGDALQISSNNSGCGDGEIASSNIMARNISSVVNHNSGYMSNFGINFSNPKEDTSGKVSKSSCDAPPNSQNQLNANTNNSMQTSDEASVQNASSVGPFGTNLLSNTPITPSLGVFSSASLSILGSGSQYSNSGVLLGSESSQAFTSAGVWPQSIQNTNPTTNGDFLNFSGNSIESRASGEGHDNEN